VKEFNCGPWLWDALVPIKGNHGITHFDELSSVPTASVGGVDNGTFWKLLHEVPHDIYEDWEVIATLVHSQPSGRWHFDGRGRSEGPSN